MDSINFTANKFVAVTLSAAFVLGLFCMGIIHTSLFRDKIPHCADVIISDVCRHCETNYYLTETGKCIPQDINHCGTDGLSKCQSVIAHWKDGYCRNDACQVTECQHGYYVNDGECKPQSAEHCGNKGQLNCLETEGVAQANCVNGRCKITDCKEGYFRDGNNCRDVSDAACPMGGRIVNCHIAFRNNGWLDGECSQGACRATECASGYHLYNGICERDDEYNCGEHGNNCLVGGVIKARCVAGQNAEAECLADRCDEQHYLDIEDNICRVHDLTHCGENGTIDCTKNVGWGDGDCVNKHCVLNRCRKGYSLDKHAFSDTCDCDETSFGDGLIDKIRSAETSCVYEED